MRFGVLKRDLQLWERIYSFAFYALLATALYGIFQAVFSLSFEPSPWIRSWDYAHPVGMALASMLFSLPVLLDRYPTDAIRGKPLKRVLLYIGMSGMTFVWVWVSVTRAIPHASLLLSSQAYTAYAAIARKSGGSFNRRGCDYKLWTVDLTSTWRYRLCVSEGFWSAANIDDVVEIRGVENAFGRKALNVSLQHANKQPKPTPNLDPKK